MSPNPREYQLSPDQPILRRARGRRPAHRMKPRPVEQDFWRNFNLEKFACDWRRGLGVQPVRKA